MCTLAVFLIFTLVSQAWKETAFLILKRAGKKRQTDKEGDVGLDGIKHQCVGLIVPGQYRKHDQPCLIPAFPADLPHFSRDLALVHLLSCKHVFVGCKITPLRSI